MPNKYRIVHVVENEENVYSIRQVFYSHEGFPIAMTNDEASPFGATLNEFQDDFAEYVKAIQYPAIEYPADFDRQDVPEVAKPLVEPPSRKDAN